MSRVKLYCFPFAGGAASSYSQWRQYIASDIELRPIELAGRGRRMRDPKYNSIDDAVDDVFNIIKGEILLGEYAFYGHSMGSMIAIELAYKIKQLGLPGPIHLIVSGRCAPQIPRTNKRVLHHLDDETFKKELIDMGGTPKELFEHPELMELFLPLLKADFTLTETYVHSQKDAPLDCDITAMAGKEDEDSPEEVEAWGIYTRGKFNIHYFDGGHFFIYDEPQRVLGIINDAIHNSK